MTGERDCSQGNLLSAYLDGELARDVAGTFERHLAGCPDCSDAYEVMKANDRLLRDALPIEKPPAFLKAQLFQKIENETEDPSIFANIRKLFSINTRSWAYACAPVVLLAMVISAVHIQQRIEHRRILAQIDRSKAEWAVHDKAANPFDIDVNGTPRQMPGDNPFDSYLNQH